MTGAGLEGGDTSPEDENIEQLKADIAETRDERQQTVAEIQDRLSPSTLGEQAREATIGRVEHMMHRAGDNVSRAADATRHAAGAVKSNMRDNAIPYALIGVGVAWLLASSRRHHWSEMADDRETAWFGGSDTQASPPEYESSSGYGSTEWAGGAAGDYDERRRYAEGGEAPGARGDSDRRHRMEGARRRVRAVATRARGRWDSMVHDNPMALGIAALAAGALVGAAFPATRAEDEYMGETRDGMLDSAREMAGTTADRLKEEAGRIVSGESGSEQAARPAHTPGVPGSPSAGTTNVGP